MTSFTTEIIWQNPQEQLSLDTLIELSGRAANILWKETALQQVKCVCREHHTFTTDTVRERLDKMNVATKNMSALGAVMREAAQNGWCHLANEWTQSERPEAHQRAIRVWHSLLLHPPQNYEQ